jgi:hypothetical protein
MPFETHPHLIAVTIFILALLVVFFVKNLRDPSSVWTLICGILLVGIGAWALDGFGTMESFFNVLHQANKIDGEQLQQAQHATKLWTLVLPAVVAAMGANLITSWSLFRKSSRVSAENG